MLSGTLPPPRGPGPPALEASLRASSLPGRLEILLRWPVTSAAYVPVSDARVDGVFSVEHLSGIVQSGSFFEMTLPIDADSQRFFKLKPRP